MKVETTRLSSNSLELHDLELHASHRPCPDSRAWTNALPFDMRSGVHFKGKEEVSDGATFGDYVAQ